MENGDTLKLLMSNMLVVKSFYRFLFEDSTGTSDPHFEKSSPFSRLY